MSKKGEIIRNKSAKSLSIFNNISLALVIFLSLVLLVGGASFIYIMNFVDFNTISLYIHNTMYIRT
jgi:hypothetical protein